MMHSIIIIFVEINMTKTVVEFENELVSCDTFVVMPDVSETGEVRCEKLIQISKYETMKYKGHFREELR